MTASFTLSGLDVLILGVCAGAGVEFGRTAMRFILEYLELARPKTSIKTK